MSVGKSYHEMQDERLRWEKERVRVQDERTAFRRQIRDQARRETFAEQVVRRAKEEIEPLDFKPRLRPTGDGGNDLVVHLTDLHVGVGIDNAWNKYDGKILVRRLCEYLQKIYDVQARHGSENAYVIIGGDVISGGIHATLRIENNEDVIDQLLTACDLLSQFFAEMSRTFGVVHAYLTPGNHGRIQANKDLDIAHENLDNLVLPFVEAKLQNYENVIFHQNEIEQSMAVFSVRGNLVYASHGDKDRFNKATERLTMMLGRQPDLIYLGHMHNNAMATQANTKIIQSGSLSGPDQYCMDKRIQGRAEQTISVVNEDGLECLYDVRFKS